MASEGNARFLYITATCRPISQGNLSTWNNIESFVFNLIFIPRFLVQNILLTVERITMSLSYGLHDLVFSIRSICLLTSVLACEFCIFYHLDVLVRKLLITSFHTLSCCCVLVQVHIFGQIMTFFHFKTFENFL